MQFTVLAVLLSTRSEAGALATKAGFGEDRFGQTTLAEVLSRPGCEQNKWLLSVEPDYTVVSCASTFDRKPIRVDYTFDLTSALFIMNILARPEAAALTDHGPSFQRSRQALCADLIDLLVQAWGEPEPTRSTCVREWVPGVQEAHCASPAARKAMIRAGQGSILQWEDGEIKSDLNYMAGGTVENGDRWNSCDLRIMNERLRKAWLQTRDEYQRKDALDKLR